MVGIFIGIAAVIALISLGQGLQNTIKEQFEKMGSNKIIVSPGGSVMDTMSDEKLTQEDYDIIDKVDGVDLTAEVSYSSTFIEFKDEKKATFVAGFPADKTSKVITDMEGFKIDKGRNLKDGDTYKAIVGSMIAEEKGLFRKAVSTGDKILIKDKEFEVVGIMESLGNPQDDTQIYIPLETAKEIFDKKDKIDMIYVQVKAGYNIDNVAEEIKSELRKLRDEKEGEETFSVQTFQQLLKSFQEVLGVVQAVLIGIAAISLIVGGIGIMNTMYTAVLERTREIGTMKAVGAKNSDILFIFLIEAGLLGLVGGVIGIFIGIGLGKGAEYIAGFALRTNLLKAAFPVYILGGALLFSFLIGTLSGIFPAMQAAKLKPADALRYE